MMGNAFNNLLHKVTQCLCSGRVQESPERAFGASGEEGLDMRFHNISIMDFIFELTKRIYFVFTIAFFIWN